MIQLKNITKIYKTKGGEPVKALDNVSFTLPDKGLVFILGKSGCGKSTLLNVAGGLDKPTEGEIVVKGRSSKDFTQSDFDSYRNTYVGFIFQEYNVMPEFTVKENVTLATELQGKKPDGKAMEAILDEVDLKGLDRRKPMTLSGGQKQRVAIARALVKDPQIILADEPTGALDSNTGKTVLDLLKRLSREKLVVVVSHDRDFANRYADRIIELHDGRILTDMSFVREKATEGDMAIVGDNVRLTKDVNAEMLSTLNALLHEKKIVTLTLEEEGTVLEGGRFVPTPEQPEEQVKGEPERLIRSKFPLKYAARMGAAGLKTKRFRLIMTVLLSTVALTAFGFMLTLMTFNERTALRNALNESGQTEIAIANYRVWTQTIPVINMEYERTSPVLSDSGRIKALEEKTGLEFLKIQNFSHGGGVFSTGNSDFNFAEYSGTEFYYPSSFCGFAVTNEEQLARFGAKIEYGRLPESADEIAISSLVMQAMYYRGATDAEGVKLMRYLGDVPIGKTFAIRGTGTINAKICGVFSAPLPGNKYDELKTAGEIILAAQSDRDAANIGAVARLHNLKNELDSLYDSSLSTVGLVAPGFFAANASKMGPDDYKYLNCRFDSGNGTEDFIMKTDPLGGDVTPLLLEGEKQEDDSCLITREAFYSLVWLLKDLKESERESICYILENGTDEAVLETLAQMKARYPGLFTVTVFTRDGSVTKTFRIAGIVREERIYTLSGLYFTENGYRTLHSDANGDDLESADFLLTVNTPEARRIITGEDLAEKDSDDMKFIICRNYQYDRIKEYSEIIFTLSNVFFWVGVVVAVFAALLLFNFISVSINFKKRDIGILRAIGARKVDVFKVFFSESMMIIGACYILAVIASIVLSIRFGVFLKEELFVSTTLFFFGPLEALILAALAAGVAFVSTILPVHHYAKKPPVDAIRAL